MNIAIIPARGGSKRIPNKNLKFFSGKPIITYAIENAFKSSIFDQVIVSTDVSSIAEIALKHGASVPGLRSKALSDDFATTLSVIKSVIIDNFKAKSNEISFCCIYPTTPLLDYKHLDESRKILEANADKFIFASTRVDIAFDRTFSVSSNGSISFQKKGFTNHRSQDLPEFFIDAGQFYWGKGKTWLEKDEILADGAIAYDLSLDKVVDINTISDWDYAEYLFDKSKPR